MDPATAAGLGLQVTSLAFQLFAGCIEGFVLLSTAGNMGKTAGTLICMLNLQEVQLTEWARRAGLLSGDFTLDRRLNAAVIESTLRELKSLMVDTEKLKVRYKLQLKDEPLSKKDTPSDRSSQLVESILSSTISDETRKDVMYLGRVLKTRNSFPKRLWWATVDKEAFEALVEEIRRLVRELWQLVDPLQRDDMVTNMKTILTHVIAVSGRVENLVSLQQALSQPSEHSVKCNNNDNQAVLASVAGLKAINVELEHEDDHGRVLGANQEDEDGKPPTVVPKSASPELLETAQIESFMPLKGIREMGVAVYQNEHVFLEWKNMPRRERSKLLHRADSLARLLRAPKHTAFRSLQCKGLARDNDAARIAFVYHLPKPPGEDGPPRTLRSLFASTGPSVTDRIRLALQITQSVQYFHAAGWLHKNLRSENILFFNKQSDKALPEPTVTGFAFARLDNPSEISEQPSGDPQRDIYRHPDAMGEPSVCFDPSKDIYALGTILLEIGEWRSLRSLVDKVVNLNRDDVPLLDLAKVQPYLTGEATGGGLDTLRFRMGDIYHNVAKIMLTGFVPRTNDLHAASKSDVLAVCVRELQRCVV